MDDTGKEIYNKKFTIGDYNIALNLDIEAAGYLHINNPNSRDLLIRKMNMCNLVDIWRMCYPMRRQCTFNKKQTKNYTRAWFDYFLLRENSKEIIKDVLIGQMCSLSDHRPVYLQVSFSIVQKGKVFWRMRNELLTDFELINGCNEVIKNTLT